MTLTFLHTAEVHCATFDALRDRIAPGAILTHVVRPDWLARAQGGIDADLPGEIAAAVGEAPGRVICTCTTIGEAAEAAGAMRADEPMMQAAARAEGPVLMAYCLQSTWQPSLGLLQRAFKSEAAPQKVYPLMLGRYWPLFEVGASRDFGTAIAGEVRQAVAQRGDVVVVVLAQASMAGAADLLGDLGVPVLASPVMALKAGLGLR